MSDRKKNLLVIEDSDEDFMALARTISKANIANSLYRCEDGEEALDFLYHQGKYSDKSSSPRPALIILDLNLPGTDGREVLTKLKEDLSLQTIPIVVFSTSSNPIDIDACYHQGVSGYIVKPMDIKCLDRSIKNILNYWFHTVELPN